MPDVTDAVYPNAACFLQFKQTAQSMDENLVRFDGPQRAAESEMQMSGSPPEASESILCMQNTSLPLSAKSQISASVQGNSGTCVGDFSDLAVALRGNMFWQRHVWE